MEEEMKQAPRAVMSQRWLDQMRSSLTGADMADLLAMQDPLINLNRQNAPEHSQTIYRKKLFSDRVIGDYISSEENCKTIKVTKEVRLYMVTVIMEVHRLKNYREETLYLALSIADRFLAALLEQGRASPCLIHLAFVSILMAAKLEEPMQPSFKRMAALAKKEWEFDTAVVDLIALET